MKFAQIYLLILLLLPSAQAHAGVHAQSVEQTLAFLVNDWTIEGFEEKYRETCRWWEGQSFVICETLDQTEGTAEKSVSIFGWSEATQNFTYHHYAANGRSRSEPCFANEDLGLTCLGSRVADDGYFQYRSRVWPTAKGAKFVAERSINGGDWKETARFTYVPYRTQD